MDKSERRFQGKISADYEFVMQGIPHLSAIDEQLVNAIRAYTPAVPAPRLNVLEIGCGSGRATTRFLSSRPDIKLVAIDNEPEMLAQAEQSLRDEIKQNTLELVQRDALAYLQSVAELGSKSGHLQPDILRYGGVGWKRYHDRRIRRNSVNRQ